MEKHICTFFGHRDALLSKTEEETLKELVIDLIVHKNVCEFWFGGYGRFDGDAATIVKQLQEQYPHIKRCRVLAYYRPNEEDYRLIQNVYDYTLFPKGLENSPLRFAIKKRNNYMIDMSDYLICYVRYQYGGAYLAMKRALHKKKKVYNLLTI